MSVKYYLKITNKPFFLFFMLILVLVEVSDTIVPFSSKTSDLSSIVLYYLINFYVCICFCLSCLFTKKIRVSFPSPQNIEKLLILILVISFISLIMVSYDRLFIQNVDYSKGLAYAREMWRSNKQVREGVSSLYNVFGNLSFPFVFFGVSFVIIFFEELTRKRLYLYLYIIEIFTFSALTGGRELLLIMVAIFFSSLAVRHCMYKYYVPKNLKSELIFIFTLVVIFAVYIAFIRSKSYAFGLEQYALSLATRLGASDQKSYGIGDNTPEILLPIFIYFCHVKWIFINTLDSSNFEGISTFRQILAMFKYYLPYWFENYTIVAPEYSPNWISLIGSIYFDFGILGIIIFSAILNFIPFVWEKTLKVFEFNISLLSLSIMIFSGGLIIFAPFSFLLEIVQYIYLIVFVVLLALLALLFSGSSNSKV